MPFYTLEILSEWTEQHTCAAMAWRDYPVDVTDVTGQTDVDAGKLAMWHIAYAPPELVDELEADASCVVITKQAMTDDEIQRPLDEIGDPPKGNAISRAKNPDANSSTTDRSELTAFLNEKEVDTSAVKSGVSRKQLADDLKAVLKELPSKETGEITKR